MRRTDFPLPTTWDGTSLQFLGFAGFVPLVGLRWNEVLASHGIYVVLLPVADAPQEFLPDNPVKRRNLKRYTVADLENRWVTGTPIVYIGKAMGPEGLQQRLRPFSRRSGSHSGGRSIWHLPVADELLVCWTPTPDHVAKHVESDYIDAFEDTFGMKPFANVRAW